MDDDECFASYGLGRMDLANKPLFDRYFSTCKTRLSDYSFANTFIWRDAIHLGWRLIDGCLCVFVNGSEGLTLLFPPIGPGDIARAVRESVALCDDYNAAAGLVGATRIEYVSEEYLRKLPGGFDAQPMSGDYVYETRRMIDLDGGDLAGKRQARNRYPRRYEARTETFGPEHTDACIRLLALWHDQHEVHSADVLSAVHLKRLKEESATADALRNAEPLGLKGMVLYAGQTLVGFTLGETLDEDSCSILIEKTDRSYAGSAQYIFSEFCRRHWADSRWCNAGDDWEVASLAYAKESYHPAMRIPKWAVWPVRATRVTAPALAPSTVETAAAPRVPCRAGLGDLADLVDLEHGAFTDDLALGRRRFRYLLKCPRAETYVLRRDGRLVAEAVILRRRVPHGMLARLYSMAVAPECRGQGLGKTLLAGCLDALRAEGVPAVVLEVDMTNEPAIGMYEGAGFRRVRPLWHYYGLGRHAWKMRLDLAGVPARVAEGQTGGWRADKPAATAPPTMATSVYVRPRGAARRRCLRTPASL